MTGDSDWTTDGDTPLELLTLPASTLDRVSRPAVRDAVQYFTPGLITIPGARTPTAEATARNAAPDIPVLHPQLARSVAIQYDPTRLIIEALERLHQRGINSATIDDVTREACRINQPLTVEVFFTQTRREDVLTADGDIDESMLADPTVYKSGIHFQFKYHLYHIGLLTEGGTDTKSEVLENTWQLQQSVQI